MIAEIVSVGTELLLGQITDSNAQRLGVLFAECGIDHYHRQTVGDNLTRLTEALNLALSRSSIVITIGGLGPTEDDLTRDGIAAALEDELVVDDGVAKLLKEIFRRRGLPWTETQLRQAMRPRCGEPIANPNGTAPGLICRKDGKVVVALPGPPQELIPMIEGPVRTLLLELGGGGMLVSRTARICGLGEAFVEERIRDLIHASDPTVAPYAKPTELHLRITTRARSQPEGESRIQGVIDELTKRLGAYLYGFDATTLEMALVEGLALRKETVATAESCTGGLIAGRITSAPGSSDIFPGGIVSYANEVKSRDLGVQEATLAAHGAVSRETAAEMAVGARSHFGTTYGLSVTGIAGPGGGSDEKPVGLVYIGLATATGVEVQRHQFRGTRTIIRERSAQAALNWLWLTHRESDTIVP